MQNVQHTTNCATRILKVDYLSISKQPKKFGVSEMQGSGTGNLTMPLVLNTREITPHKIWKIISEQNI